MKNKFSKIAMFAAVIAAGFATSSCKNDDDSPAGGNVKYTVTINGVESSDFVSVAISGGTDTEVYNQWKVNGAVRSGESGIGLGKDDFMGATKTYVIESSKPLTHISSGIQVINFDKPLDISLKIEKDGKTVASETKSLSGNGADFTKNYNF